MPDPFYPSVDFNYIEQQLKNTGKFEGYFSIGQTKTFVIKGNQAIHKRTIRIRELIAGQVCYEQTTGLAARFGFMGALLEWLEKNRDWKEGAYAVPKSQQASN
jgi:hypothetical protein